MRNRVDMERNWDCIVVGGGAAGLSAALVLGRARRRTLVVDAGGQSNRAAHGIGGLLGFDGRPPAELYAQGRRELAAYPTVEVVDGTVTQGRRDGDDGFVLTMAAGGDASAALGTPEPLAPAARVESTRTVLLATGMEYRPTPLPGLEPLWGGTVFHCPFCHGWEVRGEPLAVLAPGEHALHLGLMLGAWSDDVVVLADDVPVDGRARLAAAGVAVDERPVARLRARDGKLAAVVFEDGAELERGGLLVATTLHQRADLARQLGAELGGDSPIAADGVVVDMMQATSVPGLWAAGDTTGQPPSVPAAISSGAFAASVIVRSLQGV